MRNIAIVLRASGVVDRQMQMDAVGEEQATGFTIGIGTSTSVGKMTLTPREEMIYNRD